MLGGEVFYRQVLDDLYDGVYFVDSQRRITYWNRGAERISGYRAEDVMGSCCADNLLMHVDEGGVRLCPSGCPVHATLNDGQRREARVYMHHKNGHRMPVRVRVSPLRDESGAMVGAIEIFSENSTEVSALARASELEKVAYLDPMTGLANRRYLDMHLRARCEELKRYEWPFGVLFCDVDGFKAVNDGHGHPTGDRVLAMVARTMLGTLRPFDLASRYGGEEFVVVLVRVQREGLSHAAERLRALVQSSFLAHGEAQVGVTISVGATLARPGESPAALIARADELMFAAKRAGRNRVEMEAE